MPAQTDTTIRISSESLEGLKELKPDLGRTHEAVVAELLRRQEEGELGQMDVDLRETAWLDGGEENGEFQVVAVRTRGRDPIVELDDGREFTADEFYALTQLGVFRPAD